MEVNSLWNRGYGKAATRSAQTLLLLALAGVVIYGLLQLKLIVVPIVIAVILASALSPVITALDRLKMKRAVSSFLTLLSLVLTLGLSAWFIVISVRKEWKSHSDSLSEKFDKAIEWLHSGAIPIPGEQVDKVINSSKQYLTSASFGEGALQFSSTLGSVVTGTFLTLIILFFLMKDGEQIFKFLARFLKPSLREKTHEAGSKAVTVLGNYIRGTTIVALVDAALIGIGLWIMGVPLIIPLCLLVFIGAFIPYVGSISAGVIISLIALVGKDLDTAIIVAIIVLAVNQIEGLLSPIILGNVLKMNTLAILVTLSVGAIVGGILGALMAVPVAAVSWVFWTTWNKPSQEVEPETMQLMEPAEEDVQIEEKNETA